MRTTPSPPRTSPATHSVGPVVRRVAGLLTILSLAACTTIDHGPDLEHAAAHIVTAVGDDAVLPAGWEGTGWDGHSPLDEATAVRTALVSNRTIRAALERIAMARADLVQAGLLPNPVVSVAFGFPIDGGGGPVTVGAGVTQQLVALWLRGDRIRAADLALESEILAVSQEALAIVREVRTACARILHTERELDLLRDDEALVDRLVELVEAQRRAGEASGLDVGRVGLRRQALRADRADVERRRVDERLALLALLGRADAPVDFSIERDRSPTGDGWRPLPDDATIAAVVAAQRLEVLAARVRADALAAEVRLEGRRRIGGTTVGAEFGRDDDRRQHLGPSAAIEVPIFDANDAQIARAAAAHRQALHEMHRARDGAIVAARTAVGRLERIRELLRWWEIEMLPAAESQLELLRQALTAGEVDLTALIEAERERNDARRRLVRLRLDEAISTIDLDHALGGDWSPPDG